MKIIERGTKIDKCPRCGCKFEWNINDVKTRDGFLCRSISYITCPQCTYYIDLD